MDDFASKEEMMDTLEEQQLRQMQLDAIKIFTQDEYLKQEQAAVLKESRLTEIKALLGSKLMLAIVISCCVSIVMTTLKGIRTVVQSFNNIFATLINVLAILVSILIMRYFAQGGLQLYKYGKGSGDEKLQKGVKNIKGGLISCMVILSLLFALLLAVTVFAFISANALNSVQGSISSNHPGVAAIGMGMVMFMGCIILAIVYPLAIYFLNGSKKVTTDLLYRVEDRALGNPKILPLAIMLLIVGVIIMVIQIAVTIGGSVLSGSLLARFNVVSSVKVNAARVINAIFSYVEIIVALIPYIAGAILLLKYRTLINKLYSPMYQPQFSSNYTGKTL